MTISSLFKAVFRVNRWPFYISDIYIKTVQQYIWKMKKFSIGKNTTWLGFPIISNTTGGSVEVGSGCLICSRSNDTALGVSHRTILRTLSSGAKIRIGNNVRMSGTTICAATSIKIGNRCVIGADVIIADTDFHSLDPVSRSSDEDAINAISKPVEIGNDVFIGGRSIILKGVTLGDKVIVGAGSIVTKSFTEGSIIAGNPALEIGNIIKS